MINIKGMLVALVLAMVVSPFLAYAENGLTANFSHESFSLATTTLNYRKAEICHNATKKPLLIVYLHGGSARGNDNETQLSEVAVDSIYTYLSQHKIAATMIVPQCPAGGGWISTLRRVVNELAKTYLTNDLADSNRVYVVGGSMGGTGTWCQLGNYPDFYAAAMPVAGNPTGYNVENIATTPVYAVMGTKDAIMSVTPVSNMQASVTALGGTMLLDVVDGWTHQETCEQSYTKERLDWLFSQTKGALTGDVNCDGTVDVADINTVINIVLGKDDGSGNKSRADVNNDGAIDVDDINIIINIIMNP